MNRRILTSGSLAAGILLLGSACGGTTGTPAASVAVPSRVEVSAAMITAKDLPAGFRQVPVPSNAGVSATGPNAACTDLAALMFSDTMQGGAFEVDRDFANRARVSITESIVPYTTTQAAAAAVKRFGVDVSYCPSLWVADHGHGAQFALSTAPAPLTGSQSYAMTMTARNGTASLIVWSTVVLDGANVVVVNAPTRAEANLVTARAIRKLRASNA